MCAFYDWNILLDEEGGPNHVGNFCDAPYLFHRERKQLITTW
jgi:glucosylceramidase